MISSRLLVSLLPLGALLSAPAHSAESPGDRMLAAYFQAQTADIQKQSLAGIRGLDDWKTQREAYRNELRDMLGLLPWPERTPLNVTITGREEHAQFTVEKLHFQSRPGLYVTANLYVPNPRPTKAPTIVYLSGHSRVKEGNVSFGSKASYQQHGAWFARNGYVCLTLDSIGELGEIEGMHHGVYSAGRWWWYARGYTPAGVEAWNVIRALDYLETLPEVDAGRFGVTGRSGGGVDTWWSAALDERIKVAVPVAGMTDLYDQVVVGKASRHCDCMFMINTYRWDFGEVAALLAPRPLLISNSDKDEIFPLDGVVRLHHAAAAIYGLYGETDKLGLLITEGPHQDTQDLQVPAFRWFNRFLKGDRSVIDGSANKLFTPAQLKVFATLPADERNTTVDQWFVPTAKPAAPKSVGEWSTLRASLLGSLTTKCFAGWPAQDLARQPKPLGRESHGTLTLTRWEFTSQHSVNLPLFVFTGPGTPSHVELVVLDETDWKELAAALGDQWAVLEAAQPVSQLMPGRHTALLERVARGEAAVAFFAPRGLGPSAWSGDETAQTHIRRRFMLLGQTLDGMRVWDIRQAVAALQDPAVFGPKPVVVSAQRTQAVNALYASLFTQHVTALELHAMPASHQIGPDYLNVLRHLDIPQAVALAADQRRVRLMDSAAEPWAWAVTTQRQLGWPADRLQITP